MPTKRNKLLILALFTLIISLSCLVDSMLCVMTGGTMVWEGYHRGQPYSKAQGITKQKDAAEFCRILRFQPNNARPHFGDQRAALLKIISLTGQKDQWM